MDEGVQLDDPSFEIQTYGNLKMLLEDDDERLVIKDEISGWCLAIAYRHQRIAMQIVLLLQLIIFNFENVCDII